jgi:hypothetical protein
MNTSEVIRMLKAKYGLKQDIALEKLLRILSKTDRENILPNLKQEPKYKKLIVEYLNEEDK